MSEARSSAPYRAYHVGSLLRPESVKAARQAHFEAGTLDADGLRQVEDDAVRDIVAMQECVGLAAVTDGEQRRSFWHYDFMGALTGMELVERGEGVQFKGATLRPIHPTITGRLDFPSDHPMLAHFDYLASVASVQPKISLSRGRAPAISVRDPTTSRPLSTRPCWRQRRSPPGGWATSRR